MIGEWISATLSNFGLCMFILAILIIIIHSPIAMLRHHTSPFEIIYRWIALLPLGVTAIYAFIMHLLFPTFTAATIGWASSPFQFEVAMANLGFGLIAILSFRAGYGFRLATVIGSTCWLWGDALVHLYDMVVHQNFAIGNAGSWFWLDLIIPLILIICMMRLKPISDIR